MEQSLKICKSCNVNVVKYKSRSTCNLCYNQKYYLHQICYNISWKLKNGYYLCPKESEIYNTVYFKMLEEREKRRKEINKEAKEEAKKAAKEAAKSKKKAIALEKKLAKILGPVR